MRYFKILLLLTLLLMASFNDMGAKEVIVAPPPKQIFSELTSKDQNRLNVQRKVIEAHLSHSSHEKYKTVAGKLGLLRALIKQNIFKPDQKYELQCMGIVLGDALNQELGMHWIIVEDGMGRDPAIRQGESSIIMFPMTMISKRIESNDEIDVIDFFNMVVEHTKELAKTTN